MPARTPAFLGWLPATSRARSTGVLAGLLALLAPSTARADLDLVFLIDTTGSMSSEIREAKERVRQIAGALQTARPQETIRLGVVAFRDRGDEYLTREQPLSSNIDQVFGFLATVEADGGGDSPEDVLAGLSHAIHKMDWAQGAEHQIFLIGDAPPQLGYADNPSVESLLSAARARRVVVNGVGCRSLSQHGVAFFRKVSYATEGRYQHIGRVQADEGGLAEAMLSTLAGPPAVETHAPFVLRSSSERPVQEGGPHGVLARLGTWWSPLEKSPDGDRVCTVTVMLPPGFGLASPVSASLAESGLHLTLPLGPGEGGVRLYEPESCLDASTPVFVHLSE
jgi:hypothetical protein